MATSVGLSDREQALLVLRTLEAIDAERVQLRIEQVGQGAADNVRVLPTYSIAPGEQYPTYVERRKELKAKQDRIEAEFDGLMDIVREIASSRS